MACDIQTNSLTFEKSLRILSPTMNSPDLYKLLTFIRKYVEWPKHKKNIAKIHEDGSIKKILSCLNSKHSNIIAVSLSILGNCCLESKCAIEVGSKGINDLYHLLQKYSKDDGVNGRVFRIIGNICQHYGGDYILKSKGQIVTYILKFIQKYADDQDPKICEATMLMAVRVIGKFMNRQTYLSLVEKYDMLKPIGALFIKCSMRWNAEKKCQTLVEHLIKFLYNFSEYKYAPGIAELRNTSHGDTLACLSEVLPLAPETIVNMVMNFLLVSRLKSELPVQDIIAGFVKLLKEASRNNHEVDKQHKDYIRCLCYLLNNPVNRDPMRLNDTIPQLIRTFDEVQDPSNDMIEILCLILETFERCTYHQHIMKQQVNNNMIEVLANKMESILGNRECLKMKHRLVKPRKENFSKCKENGWDSFPVSSDDEMEIMNASVLSPFRPSSPGSGSDSEMMTSPFASPRASPSPPGKATTFYPEESDSEDYSPVCSDNEEDTKMDPRSIHEYCEEFIEIEKFLKKKDDKEDAEKINEQDLKYRLIQRSLGLMKIYSNMQPLPSHLCSDSLLMILAKCACYFDPSSQATKMAQDVISKILSVHEYLIPLMQTGLIYSFSSLLKTDHSSNCETCDHYRRVGIHALDKFTEFIESGGGRGDIANRLICGSDQQKKQLAMAIPCLVTSRNVLFYLMISCNGIKIIMDCLGDETQRKKYLEAICIMVMKQMKAADACSTCTIDKTEKVANFQVENYELPGNCENPVTFVLDDGSSLKADRDNLSQKSCYFNTLLNGAFKESNEENVRIQNTTYASLNSLIYFLNCDIDMSDYKKIELDIQTLLDVILLCHRYLLEDLCSYLVQCVRRFCISAENLPIVYKWCVDSGTDILRLDTIIYTFRERSEDICDKVNMFMKLFDIGYTDILIEDLEVVLTNFIRR